MITKQDTIVAVAAGSHDKPIWVIVRDSSGKLREECLQPEEQGVLISSGLYQIATAVHGAIVQAIRNVARGVVVDSGMPTEFGGEERID